MEIKKIVLTGGPCGGKSTGLEWICKEYEKKGWRVIAVDECATEVIKAGVTPGRSNTNFDFELPIVQLQKAKEEIFDRAAANLPDQKVLVVYDRGFLDMKTYCKPGEFEQICQEIGMTEDEMLNSYDGVFHLTSTAKGAEKYYTFANNEARYQSLEEAVKADDAILEVWKEHPFVRVIDNSTSFRTKMERLCREIDILLGESFETPQVFTYKVKPSVLYRLPEDVIVEQSRFVQTELCQKQGMFRSLVQTKRKDGTSRFFLQYAPENQPNGERIQKKISRHEYSDLLLESDPSKEPSIGNIHSFFWDNQYIELIRGAHDSNSMEMRITTKQNRSSPYIPEFLTKALLNAD